jgi:hypothetical protein
MAADIVCGLALIALSFRRGHVLLEYGNWNRMLV